MTDLAAEKMAVPAVEPSLWTWADTLMLLTVLIWGASFAVVKATLKELPPLAFNAIRYTLAIAVELAILFLSGENLSVRRRDWPKLLFVSLVGVTGYQLFYIVSISRTSASNASVIISLVPIFVALYAGLVRRQRLGIQTWVGIAITSLGIVVLTAGGGGSISVSSSSWVGDLMALFSSVCWAICTIGSSDLLKRYSATKVTALTMFGAMVVLDVIAIPELLTLSWGQISLAGWGGIVYAGALSAALAYLLWNYSLQRVGETRTAIYNNITPLIAILVAWIVLGERMTPLQVVGALVVLCGVALVRLRRRQPAQGA